MSKSYKVPICPGIYFPLPILLKILVSLFTYVLISIQMSTNIPFYHKRKIYFGCSGAANHGSPARIQG